MKKEKYTARKNKLSKLCYLITAILLLCTLCGCTELIPTELQVDDLLDSITSTTRWSELETTSTTEADTTTTTQETTTTAKKTTTAKLTTTTTTTTKLTTTTKAAPVTDEQSQTVYITKTGKRWHRNSSCNGGTYFASTLSEAEARGLTPCKKCAGG